MKIKNLFKIITAKIQKFMLFIGNFDVSKNSIFVYQKPFR